MKFRQIVAATLAALSLSGPADQAPPPQAQAPQDNGGQAGVINDIEVIDITPTDTKNPLTPQLTKEINKTVAEVEKFMDADKMIPLGLQEKLAVMLRKDGVSAQEVRDSVREEYANRNNPDYESRSRQFTDRSKIVNTNAGQLGTTNRARKASETEIEKNPLFELDKADKAVEVSAISSSKFASGVEPPKPPEASAPKLESSSPGMPPPPPRRAAKATTPSGM